MGQADQIAEFRSKILAWFDLAGRHYLTWRNANLNHYEIVISEVLLQRTSAQAVERIYAKFLGIFPDWTTIHEAEVSVIETLLMPLGLFRQRAKRIKDLAAEMVDRDGIIPSDRETIESLPLFGQYLSNAVELQIFGKPKPLLDVNMARVLERNFGQRKMVDIRYDKYLQNLAHVIVDHNRSKEISWAVLDFAAIVCRARNPHCQNCIFSDTCLYGEQVVNSVHL